MAPASDKPDFVFYQYDPSLPAAIVFIVFFAIVAVWHLWLLIRNKTWSMIPFFIGVVFEAIGYVGRVMSSQETPDWTKGPYILQTVMLLLGPTLYAASIYMVLGRIMRLLNATHYSVIRVTWLTKIFVFGDVLSFLAQALGGGLLAMAETAAEMKRGENIILAGLGIQIVFFGVFMIVTVIFHVRMTKGPTVHSVTTDWRRFLYVLYFSSVLIMIRSIFRMAEFGMGQEGALQKSEIYTFVLDTALMGLVALAFIWRHPSQIIAGYKDVGNKQTDLESQSEISLSLIENAGHGRHLSQETGYAGAQGGYGNNPYQA